MSLGLGFGLPFISVLEKNHISIWDTTKTSTGSSNSDQIKLPLEAGGTYDFVIDWGDGNKNHITTYNQAEVTHTYSTSGEKRLKISGTLQGFRFNNTGDRNKLLSIENGGKDFRLGNNNGYFYGCENLTSISKLITTGMSDFSYFLKGCVKFNSSVDWVDTSLATTTREMFRGCVLFDYPVNHFVMTNVQTTYYMFFGCEKFNQDVDNWNVVNVIVLGGTFRGCVLFNKNLSTWVTSSCTNLYEFLYGALNFNYTLAQLDISLVTNMTRMLSSANSFSDENYSNMLIAFAAGSHQEDVTLDCAAQYNASASAARTTLEGDDWTINDGGLAA